METAKHGAGESRSLVSLAIQPDEAAIDIIRTETVLSKLPRHILSKSGKRPEIRIERFTENGKLDLRWLVSFNELYGPARQLAYDLDTLIVERAIEETFEEARRAGHPLPRLIPIGSLRDLCRRLGLEENGTNAAKIKRALQQNAGAVINTVLAYRANDGSEFTLDGTFTCYGVFFTGKKLPDGRRADQTYISTTNEYHQVISTAPTRPLDYSYKMQLPPSARRLYEILSFPMYGALKNGKPFAHLLYSDYCTRAPHVRYFTFDQMKKQMYVVNKFHRSSEYILGVKYEATRDQQGNADWVMLYKPGPKAIAEFAAANPGVKTRTVEPRAIEIGEQSLQRRVRSARHARLKPPLSSQQSAPAINAEYLAALVKRGVLQKEAEEALVDFPEDCPIMDTLEWADAEIAKNPRKWTNPAGWYVKLVKGRMPPPATWETRAQREARVEANRKRQEEREAEQDLLAATEQAEDQMLDELQASDPDRYNMLFQEAEQEFMREHPSLAHWTTRDGRLYIGFIRSRIKHALNAIAKIGDAPTSDQRVPSTGLRDSQNTTSPECADGNGQAPNQEPSLEPLFILKPVLAPQAGEPLQAVQPPLHDLPQENREAEDSLTVAPAVDFAISSSESTPIVIGNPEDETELSNQEPEFASANHTAEVMTETPAPEAEPEHDPTSELKDHPRAEPEEGNRPFSQAA